MSQEPLKESSDSMSRATHGSHLDAHFFFTGFSSEGENEFWMNLLKTVIFFPPLYPLETLPNHY